MSIDGLEMIFYLVCGGLCLYFNGVFLKEQTFKNLMMLNLPSFYFVDCITDGIDEKCLPNSGSQNVYGIL